MRQVREWVCVVFDEQGRLLVDCKQSQSPWRFLRVPLFWRETRRAARVCYYVRALGGSIRTYFFWHDLTTNLYYNQTSPISVISNVVRYHFTLRIHRSSTARAGVYLPKNYTCGFQTLSLPTYKVIDSDGWLV